MSGPRRLLTSTVLRRPATLAPPPAPKTRADETARTVADTALERRLAKCSADLSRAAPGDQPAQATAIALAACAAACESWLWTAAGNSGHVPKKSQGGAPTQSDLKLHARSAAKTGP